MLNCRGLCAPVRGGIRYTAKRTVQNSCEGKLFKPRNNAYIFLRRISADANL